MDRRRFTAGLSLLVAGCGFRLRGDVEFPFATLYVANEPRSPFYVELRRALSGAGRIRLVDRPEDAEAILELTPILPIDEKNVLTLSGGGRVREFQLLKRIVFRIHDGKGGEWLPTSEIGIRRDFSFNDSQALAKEAEERLLLQDMQTDAIRQLVRRMKMARRPS